LVDDPWHHIAAAVGIFFVRLFLSQLVTRIEGLCVYCCCVLHRSCCSKAGKSWANNSVVTNSCTISKYTHLSPGHFLEGLI
jgi:hypothetical protein